MFMCTFRLTVAAALSTGSSPFFVAVGDVNNVQIADEGTSFVFSAANGNALTLWTLTVAARP